MYSHYADADPRFERWRDLCFEAHEQAGHALRLEPGPELVGFPHTEPGGLVGRRARDPQASWRKQVARPGERLVLLSFGGFGLEDVEEKIPRLPGIRWVTSPPAVDLGGREDATEVTGVPYPDLVAGADVVLSKPGYGMITECAVNRARLVYAQRAGFPETPALVRWLRQHLPSVQLERFEPAQVRDAIEAVLALPDRFPENVDGAGRIVEHVLGATTAA